MEEFCQCMSCDNNFKSQEQLKNLGTAVEIVSVHTDLHRHIQGTVYNQSCGSNTMWRKYLADKNEIANWCNFLRLSMFSILFENITHEKYNAAVISRCPSCQVTLQNTQSPGI